MTEPTYTKTDWVNGTTPPIDDTNLDKLEQGVADAIGRAVTSIRYDAAQSLNPTQQSLARGNMALGSASTGAATDYSPALTPSYVGARTKSFDARTSVYNGTAAGFRTVRAKANSARQGGTLSLTTIGDSTTAGAGATAQTSWPIQLLDLLGLPVRGTGAVFGSQGITDSRWASTGTVTGAGAYAQLSAAATKTFTSDRPGTDVDVRFYRNSGAFDLLIDTAIIATGVTVTGGTYNTSTGRVTPDGSLSGGKVTVTGLTSAVHTVKITSVATTYLITVNVYSSGSGGVLIANMGVSGTKVADWLSTAFASFYQQATLEPADAFILTLDVNDSSGGTAVATYKTNLQTIATNLKAIAPVILVAGINASGTSSATHQPYVSAMYDIADTLDLPLFDLFHRWGNYLNANTLGLTADTVHPNAKGYADWAQALVAVLQLSGGSSNTGGASINDITPSTSTTYSSNHIDTALTGKQAADSDLTSIAALTTTSYGRSVLTQADATALRNLLGIPSWPVVVLKEVSGAYPNRPNYPGPVEWQGPDAPAIRTDGVTTGGTAQAVQGLDSWSITP
jgi:lysophospholipase L1-like esterase